MLHESHNYRIGVGQLISAMIIAGTIGVLVLESGQSPYNIVFFRCLIGAVTLIPICCYFGVFNFQGLNRKTLIIIAVGGACLVFNWLFLFKSYQHISLSLGTVVYHIKPFVILITGAFIFSEELTKSSLIWTAIAFIGATLVVDLDFGSLSLDTQKLTGIFYAFIAAVMYSASTLIVKYVKDIPGIFIAFLQTALGVLLLYPFTSLGDMQFPDDSWKYILTLGIVNTGIMYALNYSSYQRLPAYAIAILSFIYPVVTILTDYVFYGFLFSIMQLTGVAMIFLATLGVNFGWRVLPRVQLQSR